MAMSFKIEEKKRLMNVARQDGLVIKKWFGLVKTDEVIPEVEKMIDRIVESKNLAYLMSDISKKHFNIEFKRYPNINGADITIEVDGIVNVYMYDMQKTFPENLEWSFERAIESLTNNPQVNDHVGWLLKP